MDNLSAPHCDGCPDPYYCFYEGYCIHDEADDETKRADDPDTQQQAPSAPSVGYDSEKEAISIRVSRLYPDDDYTEDEIIS